MMTTAKPIGMRVSDAMSVRDRVKRWVSESRLSIEDAGRATGCIDAYVKSGESCVFSLELVDARELVEMCLENDVRKVSTFRQVPPT